MNRINNNNRKKPQTKQAKEKKCYWLKSRKTISIFNLKACVSTCSCLCISDNDTNMMIELKFNEFIKWNLKKKNHNYKEINISFTLLKFPHLSEKNIHMLKSKIWWKVTNIHN